MISLIAREGLFIINGDIVHNRIMDNTLDKMINIFQGINPDIEIKYLAIGIGTTPVSDTDTQLTNEIFRTQYISREKTATGEIKHNFVILSTEAVAEWQEIGIFGGSTATGAANSGTLIARILYYKNKNNSEEIYITRIDRVVRS